MRDPSGPAADIAQRAARGYELALIRAAPDDAERAVRDAIAAGMRCTEIFDRVITPAMDLVGGYWADGRLRVGDEHEATAVSHRMVDLVAREAVPDEPPDQPARVLLAALETERHVLGLHMADAAFRRCGHEVHMLGADVPVDELVPSVERHAPDLVGLTATSAPARSLLHLAVERLRQADPGLVILVGGSPSLTDAAAEDIVLVESVAAGIQVAAGVPRR